MVNRLQAKGGVRGRPTVTLFNVDGSIKFQHTYDNLVVPNGLTWVASRCVGGRRLTTLSHIAVGTDNTAAASTDTSLGIEVAREALIVAPYQGVGSDSNKFYCRTSYDTDTANTTLYEAALFFGSHMFSRVVFSPAVTKAEGEVLIIEWEVTMEAS